MSQKSQIVCFGLVSFVAVLTIYYRCLSFGLVVRDDFIFIFDNQDLLSPSFDGLMRFWTQDSDFLYIPVTMTFLMFSSFIEKATLGSITPGFFHGLNVLLHWLNGVILFFCLITISKPALKENSRNWSLPAFGALIFLVHPIQVEIVAQIVGLRDTLCVFFSLLSLASFLWLCGCGVWRKSFGLPFVFCVLAMLSKPTGVIVVPVIAFFGVWFHGFSWNRMLISLVPYFVAAVAVAKIATAVQPASLLVETPELWQRPIIALDSMLFYVYKIIFPISLSPNYGRTPHVVLTSGEAYFSSAGCLVLLGLLGLTHKRIPWISRGTVFFCIGLLPTLGLVPFKYQFFSTVADRYAYFSLCGISLMSLQLGQHWPNATTVRFLSIGLVLFYSAKSWTQTDAFSSREKLSSHHIRHCPECLDSLVARGLQLREQGMDDAALAMYKKIYERYKSPLSYGTMLVQMGQVDKAIQLYEEALQRYPRHPETADILYNLGVAHHRLGQQKQMIKSFRESIRSGLTGQKREQVSRLLREQESRIRVKEQPRE